MHYKVILEYHAVIPSNRLIYNTSIKQHLTIKVISGHPLVLKGVVIDLQILSIFAWPMNQIVN
jgi:hypothetical protein